MHFFPQKSCRNLKVHLQESCFPDRGHYPAEAYVTNLTLTANLVFECQHDQSATEQHDQRSSEKEHLLVKILNLEKNNPIKVVSLSESGYHGYEIIWSQSHGLNLSLCRLQQSGHPPTLRSSIKTKVSAHVPFPSACFTVNICRSGLWISVWKQHNKPADAHLSLSVFLQSTALRF